MASIVRECLSLSDLNGCQACAYHIQLRLGFDMWIGPGRVHNCSVQTVRASRSCHWMEQVMFIGSWQERHETVNGMRNDTFEPKMILQ